MYVRRICMWGLNKTKTREVCRNVVIIGKHGDLFLAAQSRHLNRLYRSAVGTHGPAVTGCVSTDLKKRVASLQLGLGQEILCKRRRIFPRQISVQTGKFRQMSRPFRRLVKFAPAPNPLLIGACAHLTLLGQVT